MIILTELVTKRLVNMHTA